MRIQRFRSSGVVAWGVTASDLAHGVREFPGQPHSDSCHELDEV